MSCDVDWPKQIALSMISPVTRWTLLSTNVYDSKTRRVSKLVLRTQEDVVIPSELNRYPDLPRSYDSNPNGFPTALGVITSVKFQYQWLRFLEELGASCVYSVCFTSFLCFFFALLRGYGEPY